MLVQETSISVEVRALASGAAGARGAEEQEEEEEEEEEEEVEVKRWKEKHIVFFIYEFHYGADNSS